MHREIAGTDAAEVDHINQNGLDNRRSNIRLGKYVNCANTRSRVGSASVYKGAHRHGDRWESSIRANGRLERLGAFASDEEAAMAYDAAARRLLGDDARYNFPVGNERPAVRT